MTREDAIKRLKEYAQYAYGIWHNEEEDTKAFDMAIEALERERIKCSHCKHYIRHDHRCGWWNHGVSNVDWCSYGERRE